MSLLHRADAIVCLGLVTKVAHAMSQRVATLPWCTNPDTPK